MFVGHYAAAFALKGKEKSASLGMLFIATQFVDILFFPFVLAGIENLKFTKNFTAVNDFNMDYYPFTHGLFSSILWGFVWYLLYYFIFTKKNKNIAIVMAIAVISHWFLDLIVHTPDLPLFYGNPKFGLGFWQQKKLTFFTESILLIASVLYYLKKTKPFTKTGKWGIPLFTILLLLVNYLNIFVLPKNDDITSLTISALFFYFLFAIIAYYLDKTRI